MEEPLQSAVDTECDKPEPPAPQDDSFGLGVAQIVITAATPMLEEPDQPFPPPPTEEDVQVSEQTEDTDQPSLSEEITVAEVIEELDDPTDSAPFPIGSSTGSDEDTYTGPSTAENSQSQPTGQHMPVASSTFSENNVPDELEPHQLAQLQDLKESNA